MLPPNLAIATVLTGGGRVEIEDRVVFDRPFWRLNLFRRTGPASRPQALVIAPLSGHFGWLMRDVVIGLLAAYEVFLLEWKDARDVPMSAGRFDWGANVAAIIEAIRLLGPDIAVIGVSQATAPILSAAALMAEDLDPARPRAMVLMGGFIDPRINQTAIGRLANRLPPGWFATIMATPVAVGHVGAGRRVYRGDIHAQTLNRYLMRHMASGGELARKTNADDGSDPKHFPFLKLFWTLMDLPAEFAEDNARIVFRESLLARGKFQINGRLVSPSAIQDISLMTVEGGRDDSSGIGQTLAAHALCHRIPDDRRAHCHIPDAGHFGLFHGEPWRSRILPQVTAFLQQAMNQ